MRAAICFSMFLCGVLCQDINQMSNMPKYDSRYDYLDVDAIFTNKRLIRAYVDCLINSNRCTPEGKALKRLLPEALRTKCVRCTERQKRTAVKIITRLKYEYPEEWAKLAVRWDPTGDFTRYFEEYLAKEHFNTIPGSDSVIPLSIANQPPRPTTWEQQPVAPTRAPAPPSPMPTQRPVPVPTQRPLPRPVPTQRPLPPTPEPEPVLPVASSPPPVFMSTPPRPAIVNRFGGDGELMMGSPSSAAATTRPTPTVGKSTEPTPAQTKQTPVTWAAPTMPTRFPLLPTEVPPPYSTAITFIDQIGYKIIRTTELVTDLLRSTVRAVVG